MKVALKENQKLVVIRATDLNTITGIPMELQLAPFGEWKGYQGSDGKRIEFEVSRELGEKAVAYHRLLKERAPERDIVIDYEHQTEKDIVAPAAGWLLSGIFLKNDGIYGRVKSWTKRAEDFIRNKEYRYLSPTLLFNDVDKTTGERIPLRIKNISLTNEPFLDTIKPITAKDDATATIIYLTDSPQSINGGNTMLEMILKMLGLDPNATIDAVKAKLEEWKNAGTTVAAKYTSAMKELGLQETATVDDVKAFALKHTTFLTELGLKATDNVDQIKSVIVAAKDKGTQQVDLKDYVKKSDFQTLELQLKTRDVNDAVTAAVQKGKIAPASLEEFKKIALKDLTQFNDLMAKVPDYSAIPLQGIEAKSIAKPTDAAPDANTIEVAAKAGVSVEDIKKYGK